MAKTPTSGIGLGVDRTGGPVIDPTANVQALVEAGLKTEAMLREAEARHSHEIAAIERAHAKELREAEASRINAIREVDRIAAERTAQATAEAVKALAAQVPVIAEAVRANLDGELNPIRDRVAAMERAQYEQQGQRTGATEGRNTADELAEKIATAIATAITSRVSPMGDQVDDLQSRLDRNAGLDKYAKTRKEDRRNTISTALIAASVIVALITGIIGYLIPH